jgi:diguanylate cyclase (GGDEF)-like protein
MGNGERPVVLMVDDDAEIREQGKNIFELTHGHKFISAATFETATRALHNTTGLVVAFIDINLRGRLSGIDFLKYVHEYASHRVVPYVYTADSSELVELKALQAGAYHVFHKGTGLDTMNRLVLYTENSHVSMLVRRSAQDPMTGLDNFDALSRAVIAAMKTARDHPDRKHAEVFSLIFLDIDKFWIFNDDHGTLVGDEALRTVGRVLKAHVRPADHVGRKGGDEFVIVLPDVQLEQAEAKAREIKDAILGEPVMGKDGALVPISVSTGVSTVHRDEIGVDPEADFNKLIARAHGEESDEKKEARRLKTR